MRYQKSNIVKNRPYKGVKKAYSGVSRQSEKGKLIEEIGKLHLEYLKKLRNNPDTCEICHKKTDRLGRFHILRVGQYPKLRFIDFNVLLTGWFCCHYPHHHFGCNDPKVQHIADRIKELRGPNYRDHLLAINAAHEKITMTYLQTLKKWFERELESKERYT